MRDSLAARLGITGNGAGECGITGRFIQRGILARTKPYVPHKFSARYCWLFGANAPEQPF